MKVSRKEKYDMVNCIKNELEMMVGDLFCPERKTKEKILVALQDLETYD